MEEETRKVALVVSACVVVSLIGFWIRGILGAVLGFIITLFIFVLFSMWRRYNEMS